MNVPDAYGLRDGDLVRRLDRVGEVVCVRKSSVDVHWLDRPADEVESVAFAALEQA